MIIRDEEAMRRFGGDLAQQLRAGDLVTLTGPLGAGKTVLAKSIIAGLGFDGDVSSPTFAIIHEYDEPGMRLPVVHADLYRLNDPQELEELGLFDHDDGVVLVEWPSKGGSVLRSSDLAIEILPNPDGSRTIEIKEKRKRS
ncbi:MAG TPA: tRNA (adenosine(37)-N6)-threonylcarbamoyltransferase complex ATPase subunit type 1 TsaE [Sphingorhabdus sp.]|jgi:tRNA threonylcarbamoyladenosine biosynthesis protein TsaE|uniref:tRNA (adenosine(37)-N6)-threonylcarbamoyltransferase complex ATPase subunit type 1 TsaE n=1 Tax=Sphingorhabdus sp. TaxID=1902408 RepID=UPI002CB42F23|nr:tRNA (adenosine(37)-N6)-threonylcarbamoyltransferase complex ATPase subunit type 1 TsaE [Sphingorhabdus sp.]HMT42096.1 tRNA (adenosine(37)-N6)-threonylcarbamoyltransferase complex ATPase subunit type 1 TsaE [Sphingorhabdus sp.]HMU21677.1 tRNA (adenosine(37)-N6)-threonylcarbamoyltransferase complex ATPase subunit type 1 TsaE [Sphingorhabdus sp.]